MNSRMDDPNKAVTGYPPGYHPAQSSYNPSVQAQPSYNPTAGTAYPYAAPPHAAYYNPNPYPVHPYNPRRATFFRRLIIAAVAVFLIICIITLITWLVLRPHLPQFRVDSASVSPFNLSDSQITANWDMGFFVRNPNKKMSIYYDRMEASVFFRDEFLSVTAIAPFYQATKNQTTLQARFAAVSAYVDDRAVKLMARDQSVGVVNFNVRMLARVRFRAKGWRTRRRLMRVFCEDVTVGFTSNKGTGTLLGGSKDCKVDL